MINQYFQAHNEGYVNEQNMVESIVIEAIQITGLNVIYVPRSLNKFDQIFGEDVLSSFDSYAEIEMHLEDVTGYGGESEILGKFGMQINDTASFVVSRKRFRLAVTPIYPSNRNAKIMDRPCEGDLIYVPNTQSLFEIKFVEDEEPGFYQLNKKYVWTLRCELVTLNNENFKTGNAEIDDAFGANLNRLNMSILSESGSNLLTETGGFILSEDYSVAKEYDDMRGFGDNDTIKREFLQIMDFSETNPFGDD